MAVYLTEVRQALANLLGEDGITNPWPTVRDNSIQWSLQRIARIYDFDFGYAAQAIITDGTGKYVLSGLTAASRTDGIYDLRQVFTGGYNDNVFTAVERNDFDNYGPGDFRFYLDTDAAGVQTLVTTEPAMSLTVTYQRLSPVLSDAIPTNFPSALAIAKGALIYVREYEDKDTDVSVEDAKFQQMIQEVIGAEQRSAGPRRARNRYDTHGWGPGQIDGSGGYRY
jgi:hypothetical protein